MQNKQTALLLYSLCQRIKICQSNNRQEAVVCILSFRTLMPDLNVLNLAPDKCQTQYDMKKLKLTLKLMNPEEEMHIRKHKNVSLSPESSQRSELKASKGFV